MFKKVCFLFFFVSFYSSVCLFAMDEDDIKSEGAKIITLNSAPLKDVSSYKELLGRLPQGYPSSEGAEARYRVFNTELQEDRNSFHFYVLACKKFREGRLLKKRLGFVQLGVLSLFLNDSHPAVLQKYRDLGLIEKMGNKRIEQRGVVRIVPLFRRQISKETREKAIGEIFNTICLFAKQDEHLPFEHTTPYVAMAIIPKSDQMTIDNFVRNGFSLDETPGICWWEQHPSVMLTRKICLKTQSGTNEQF